MRKIDIFIKPVNSSKPHLTYFSSTNQSKTCSEAVESLSNKTIDPSHGILPTNARTFGKMRHQYTKNRKDYYTDGFYQAVAFVSKN